jgi:hypothetical protein
MVKYFNGQIVDAETNQGVQSVITSMVNPSLSTTTDTDGTFSFAIDDSVPAFTGWFQIAASGYGDAVTQIYGLNGTYYIYNTSASVATKAKAMIKNNLLGFLIVVLSITLLIHLSKKIL